MANLQPPLLSALAVPLIHDGTLVAVLSVYATSRGAFSEDHSRLLDLLAPRLAASIASVAGRAGAELDMRAIAATSRTPPRMASDLTLLKGRRAIG